MGISERKERQKAELREQILDAARKIVLQDGLSALSMRKIGEAIEYSPATIYLHFQNREEIAEQLVSEGFAELLTFFAPALSIADPLERVFALGRAYVRFAEERPEQYRLIFMEEDELTQHVLGGPDSAGTKMPGESAFDAITFTVKQLIDKKVMKPMDPEDGARILWASLHGLISLRFSCPDSPFGDADLPHLAEIMMNALMNGFALPKTAS